MVILLFISVKQILIFYGFYEKKKIVQRGKM